MAVFNEMIVTNDGKIQYAKSMSGKTIVFTKVKFGSGNPTNQGAAVALKDLVTSQIEGGIESIDTTTTTGVATIVASVDNSTLERAVSIKEIGVFCNDPDTQQEVMYSYCYSPTDIDVIPASSGGSVIWKIRIQLAITNASSGGGGTTEQNELLSTTPTVTATATDGSTVFVSNVVANCKHIEKSGMITAFYNISGTLTNMDKAESVLSSLTISLPKKSKVSCAVNSKMKVITDENETVIVDIFGIIEKDGLGIGIDYFGAKNGSFRLLATVQYAV